MSETLDFAISNLTSAPVLAFIMGLIVVAIRSPLTVPPQIFEFLSIYLLLAIGIKGGVSLTEAPVEELWLPILASVAVGIMIPSLVFVTLGLTTKLHRVNRGAIAATYGSTSLVTFTAGMVFIENSGLAVEGFLPALLAIMEVPGIILGIVLAKSHGSGGSMKPLLHEVFTGKSVALLIGGIVIGLVTGASGYEKIEPFFGAIFGGMLTVFLLQLGVQAGESVRELKRTGLGVIAFAAIFPLVVGPLGVFFGHAIGLGQGGSVAFGLLCGSASYIAAPAAIKLSLPDAKPAVFVTPSLGITFPINLFIGIPLLAWLAEILN